MTTNDATTIPGTTWAVIAAVAFIAAIGLTMISTSNTLEDFAVGTWQCAGAAVGEVGLSDVLDRDGTPPPPFDVLPEEFRNLRTYPLVPFEERDSVFRIELVNLMVSVSADGTFGVAGLGNNPRAHLGTWDTADGIPVIRYNDSEYVYSSTNDVNYAVDVEVGDTTARLLSWSGRSPHMYDVAVDWQDDAVSWTFNDDDYAFEADCTRSSTEPTVFADSWNADS